MSHKLPPNSYSAIESSIAAERLRQARYSFNVALIASTVSFLVSLLGAGLLVSNKASEGTIISAAGLVSSVQCLQLAKDANRRLDEIFAELNEKDEG